MYDGPVYKPICWLEWCLASIFAINAFYHIIKYIWVTTRLQPIALKPKQRRLLGVSEDEPLFKNEVPQQQKSLESSPLLNLSCINLSRRTIPLASSVLSEISMQSMYFDSVVCQILLCIEYKLYIYFFFLLRGLFHIASF